MSVYFMQSVRSTLGLHIPMLPGVPKEVQNFSRKFKENTRKDLFTSRLSNLKIKGTTGKICIGISQNAKECFVNLRKSKLSDLEPGPYLYLIEYNSTTGTFSTRFSRLRNEYEIGSRHMFMPNYNNIHSIIAVAGEVLKIKNRDGTYKVKFNLESGTIMKKLMRVYEKLNSNAEEKVKLLVKYVFRDGSTPVQYTSRTFTPKVHMRPINIMYKKGVNIEVYNSRGEKDIKNNLCRYVSGGKLGCKNFKKKNIIDMLSIITRRPVLRYPFRIKKPKLFRVR